MKNKGAIKFFAVALALVSLFHLSFTLVTYLNEKKARDFSKGDPVKEQKYLDSIAHINVYNILIKKFTYAECKERELNLGLDLQGGMHVTLEVAIPDLVRELSGNNQDPAFLKAFSNASEAVKNSQKDFITLFHDEYLKLEPNGKLSTIFATLENKDEISLSSSNDDVTAFLKKKAESALGSTFEVIRKRIDKFGVTQPNIQLLENTGRIVVELPGVDEPDRVRKLLQGSAKLEFWVTYEGKEIIPILEDVNKIIKAKKLLSGKDSGVADSAKAILKKPENQQDKGKTLTPFSKPAADKKAVEAKKPALKATDKLQAKQDPTKKADKNQLTKNVADKNAKKDTAKSLTANVNDTSKADSTKKPNQLSREEYKKEYPLYTVLTPYLDQREEGKAYYVKGPIIGTSSMNDTAEVNAYLNLPEVKSILPPDLKFAWTAKAIDKQGMIYQLIALKVTTLNKEAPLTGKAVTNSKVDISQYGEREISLSMNPEGASIWRRLTADNIGKSIAIMLDGIVYSFPTVQTEIAGGQSQITGNFSNAEAQDLANILNSGKLEVKVRIIEEAVVGPSLGKEAIKSGLLSILFGFLAVVFFMQLYYNKAGWIANLALFSNVFVIMGVLASLGAALTLPGIAGLVLTMGMSVDTNVLIYERIREEMREGKGLRLAIKDGYKMAYSAIIDANSTNFLVAIILVIFGTGPIYGFAVVLAIGILTSLFTAIFISRIIFEGLLAKEKKITFGNKYTENMFRHINVDFVGLRKYAYVFVIATLIIGAITFTFKGFDLGVDLKGGYSFVIRFDKPVNTDKLAEMLRAPLEGMPEVKTYGPTNQIQLTTSYLINDRSETTTQKVIAQIDNGFASLKTQGYNWKVMSVQRVGPTIAEDVKRSSYRSIFFALLIIFFFIFLRFKKWQFGLAAVACLFFDVVLILTIFSLFKDILPFSLAIDSSIIAALLTNVGYDNHDTIVIYDRIREKISINKRKPILEMINSAINDTMSRSLVTSFTVFLVMIVLFIFGGEIIRGFSFALLIGVIVGTLSSIFIATPLVIEFSKRGWKKEHRIEGTE
jgi:SecD/SecF fusion protein